MTYFPIQAGRTGGFALVPLSLVEAHEAQCQKNHQQSVKRLAERGGLSWNELAAVLEDRPWREMNTTEAAEACMCHVIEWARDTVRAALVARAEKAEAECDAFQNMAHEVTRERDNLKAKLAQRVDAHDVDGKALMRVTSQLAMLRTAYVDRVKCINGQYGSEETDAETLDALEEALATTYDDVEKWQKAIETQARAAAYASVALEIRASIACAARDGDELDESWVVSCAETLEGYAEGDEAPDDERNRRLLAECIATRPHPTERGVEKMSPEGVQELIRTAAEQMRAHDDGETVPGAHVRWSMREHVRSLGKCPDCSYAVVNGKCSNCEYRARE